MLVIMITTLTLQRRAILKWLFKNKSIFATKEYFFVNTFIVKYVSIIALGCGTVKKTQAQKNAVIEKE